MKFLVIFSVLLVSIAALENLYLDAKTPVKRRGVHSIGARITGGEVAAEGQFPHQAGLKINLGGQTSFCGGTLISNRDVLTAAHCCVGAQDIEVILGSVLIYNDTEPNRVSMRVLRKDVKVHKNWDSDKLVNDICMLRLPMEVELSEYIKIADLPRDDSKDYRDEIVIASGWGRDSDHTHGMSSKLKFVKSKIIKNPMCSAFYFGRILDTNVCTSGAGGMSTCSGDSGGPLVLDTKEGSSATVVGITSFGISFGCELGWPPVFTRVSKYLDWIRTNMN